MILKHRISDGEMRAVFMRICDMAVFAHRDDIANGFVSLPGGGRVGICGFAKYDGGRLIGVSAVTSLVFRIPSARCDFLDDLYAFWRDAGFPSMLVCSKAGVGKTTAIRALASKAGRGGYAKRVVVVDERCEFDILAYSECTVDILRGYKRALGIEIAIRTMSPEVLFVDEIGNEADSEALVLALGAGVPVVATAHGDDIRSLSAKPSIARLMELSLFGAYALIRSVGRARQLELGVLPFLENGG